MPNAPVKIILSFVGRGMTKKSRKKTCEAFRKDFGNLSSLRSLCLRGEFTRSHLLHLLHSLIYLVGWNM